ncbi:EpsG family protein [Metabacillus indicus]|uniref:Capsular biosynthesis protein n=1 Tax=Metabacillus indicus TaxID=246786 RepID=A0A084H4H7_METID|nr:EpsG family protein [Metabacillus indicus]KEZ50333.1 capsular biosynthesis protein [Metabacillus indicus LMG 22858]KEZ54489.1 capsular biosynthesis protein [Metabacillus indicus]
MIVMWLNLGIVYLFSFFARYFSMQPSIHYNFVKPNRIFVGLAAVCLIAVAGLQKNIGDTYFYMHSYKTNELSWQAINYTSDFGFNIYQLLLQQISSDPQILVFTTALITNLLIIIVLLKYSRIIELSVYVYIASGMFTTSMNGIRQYFAAAIVFTGTKYILNGQFKKYLVVILLASTIHKSALVLLPIYFIVRRESWTQVTFALLGIAVLIVVGFNEFSNLLFSVISNTQYGQYSHFEEGGASKIRVFVNAVPVIIAFLGRDKLRKLWPKSDYIVNMSIISVLFMVIASQNWIFARFNIYFGLYNLILLSWVVKLFKKKHEKIIYYGILICYFLYFYYEHVIGYGLIYESDYLKL